MSPVEKISQHFTSEVLDGNKALCYILGSPNHAHSGAGVDFWVEEDATPNRCCNGLPDSEVVVRIGA